VTQKRQRAEILDHDRIEAIWSLREVSLPGAGVICSCRLTKSIALKKRARR
jgi:hypothetical protein